MIITTKIACEKVGHLGNATIEKHIRSVDLSGSFSIFCDPKKIGRLHFFEGNAREQDLIYCNGKLYFPLKFYKSPKVLGVDNFRNSNVDPFGFLGLVNLSEDLLSSSDIKKYDALDDSAISIPAKLKEFRSELVIPRRERSYVSGGNMLTYTNTVEYYKSKIQNLPLVHHEGNLYLELSQLNLAFSWSANTFFLVTNNFKAASVINRDICSLIDISDFSARGNSFFKWRETPITHEQHENAIRLKDQLIDFSHLENCYMLSSYNAALLQTLGTLTNKDKYKQSDILNYFSQDIHKWSDNHIEKLASNLDLIEQIESGNITEPTMNERREDVLFLIGKAAEATSPIKRMLFHISMRRYSSINTFEDEISETIQSRVQLKNIP